MRNTSRVLKSTSGSVPRKDEEADVESGKRQIRILLRAVQLAGGEAALATALRTTPEMLAMWLSGRYQPPTRAYLAALALVTQSLQQRVNA